MVGIKDIARLTGTSLGTVSRVLNNSGYVSKANREKVEKAIQDLGYEPNAGARLMRNKRSGLIGVMVPSLDVPYFGILSHAIEQTLFNNGYHSLICNTSEDDKHEARYISTFIQQKIDGVIAVTAFSKINHFDRLSKAEIPIVAVDRPMSGYASSAIMIDHFLGGTMMAEHLLELGHQKIAIVGAPGHSASITLRIAGIEKALKKHKLKPLSINLIQEHSAQAGYELGLKALGQSEKPTAIIATTDLAAIGCIHAAHDLGLKVPDDLSVIGFDDLPEARHILPKLTTIIQPINEVGKIAALELLHIINPKLFNKPDQSGLILQLVKRDSTKAI